MRLVAELVGDDGDGLMIQALVDGHHHAHFHALGDDLRGHEVHEAGQLADGHELAHVEAALLGGHAGLLVVALLLLRPALGKAGHHLAYVVARREQLGFDLLLGLALVAAAAAARALEEPCGPIRLLVLLLVLVAVEAATSVLAGNPGEDVDDAGIRRAARIDVAAGRPAGAPESAGPAAGTARSAVLESAGPAAGTARSAVVSALVSAAGPAAGSAGTAIVSALIAAAGTARSATLIAAGAATGPAAGSARTAVVSALIAATAAGPAAGSTRSATLIAAAGAATGPAAGTARSAIVSALITALVSAAATAAGAAAVSAGAGLPVEVAGISLVALLAVAGARLVFGACLGDAGQQVLIGLLHRDLELGMQAPGLGFGVGGGEHGRGLGGFRRFRLRHGGGSGFGTGCDRRGCGFRSLCGRRVGLCRSALGRGLRGAGFDLGLRDGGLHGTDLGGHGLRRRLREPGLSRGRLAPAP